MPKNCLKSKEVAMYEDADIDATFHIPVSAALKTTFTEVEQRKEANVAPAANVTSANATPAPAVTVSSVTPVQAVPVSSSVPIQYSTAASYDDRLLYEELSRVSNEVLACRNKVLNNIF